MIAVAILCAVLGAVLASFAAVVVVRMPAGVSVIGGRSRCDACGRTLGVFELVPVVSWIALRGRCRGCGAAIDPLHVQLEIAGATAGALAGALLPPWLAVAGTAYAAALLALAALDLRHFWLPDRITLPLVAVGLAINAVVERPGLQPSIIGALAAYAVLRLIAVAYRTVRGRDGLGGGDAKLLAAIGAWSGWMSLPFVLTGACLLGLALVGLDRLRGGAVAADTRVPLGALLAVAAWPAWLWVVR